MRVMVSACLLGDNCKYSGGNNYNEELAKLLEGHEVLKVCPEVLGGLSVPRKPAEIVNGVVTNNAGSSVDKEFRLGAEKALRLALDFDPRLVILQSRSPSCGVHQIYDGSFSGRKIPGSGVFAGLIMKAGYLTVDVEDFEQLKKLLK